MEDIRRGLLLVGCLLCLGLCLSVDVGPYSWLKRDYFDEIMDKMSKVNEFNCNSMSKDSLQLDGPSTLGQLPRFTEIGKVIIHPNRTKLLQLHNMALNRAYYYSYILQMLNTSKADFKFLPGFQYYYFSGSADVSANPGIINGSGVHFDSHCQYANWYSTLDFNKTLPLFAPVAWRTDDFDDNVNWNREPTNYTIRVDDLGAGPNNNYTADWHRNRYFISDDSMDINFIPDRSIRNEGKHLYDVSINYAKKTGELYPVPNVTRQFFGPPSPGVSESGQPVYYTRPYFDCGRSNKWIVNSVSPVVDYMDRYSDQIRLRRPKYVAVTTMDIDFLKIDFNPCGHSDASSSTGLNGIARCPKATTTCEPLPGYGFQRGGYVCHCNPTYRYPYWQNGPFLGSEIEQASTEESVHFDCIPVEWKIKWLSSDGITRAVGRKKRSVSEKRELMHHLMRYGAKSKKELYEKMSAHEEEDRRLRMLYRDGPTGLEGLRRHLATQGTFTLGSLMTKASAAYSYVKDTLFTSKNATKVSWKSKHDNLPKELKKRLREDAAMMDLATGNGHGHGPKLVSRHKRSWILGEDTSTPRLGYTGRLYSFDPAAFNRTQQLFAFKNSISKENCMSKRREELQMPGEVGYGAEVHFENQGRTALRLSHFLSVFYQNNNPDEIYGPLRGDQPLNRHQLFGEVFANVMADPYIHNSGIFFDRDAFLDVETGRKMEYFAPFAFKSDSQPGQGSSIYAGSYKAQDAAGWDISDPYFEREWFKVLKQRWASNSYGLERFIEKPYIRTNISGDQVKTYEKFPMYYRAPRYEDLFWSRPYFDCSNAAYRWVITAAVPFFGNSAQKTLKFLGVVTVTVPLERLDVNYCPSNFYVPNYFKNSAPCDYESSYCVPITRNKFELSSYKCECRQGYEYPFNTPSIWYFAGGTVDSNYIKSVNEEVNFYPMLKCREASGSVLVPVVKMLLLPVLALLATTQL